MDIFLYNNNPSNMQNIKSISQEILDYIKESGSLEGLTLEIIEDEIHDILLDVAKDILETEEEKKYITKMSEKWVDFDVVFSELLWEEWYQLLLTEIKNDIKSDYDDSSEDED